MNAVGYIRVSTQGQADDGVSLEAQKAKIEAWCQANDYTLQDVYIDAGISGKAIRNRKGLQEALSSIEKGTAFVAYSMSRMSRSVTDMLNLAEEIDKRGGDLVSLTEKIDTTSAAGNLMFVIMAALHQFQRELISENTKAALAHKKSKGERVGTIPYGYQLAEDGKTLESEPLEQKILSKIGGLRESGYTLRAIADQLNQDGICTRKGSQWRHQYIDTLLKAA